MKIKDCVLLFICQHWCDSSGSKMKILTGAVLQKEKCTCLDCSHVSRLVSHHVAAVSL